MLRIRAAHPCQPARRRYKPATWLRQWGCSEAYARLIGRRSRRRGWLSSAEVRAATVLGAGVSHGQHRFSAGEQLLAAPGCRCGSSGARSPCLSPKAGVTSLNLAGCAVRPAQVSFPPVWPFTMTGVVPPMPQLPDNRSGDVRCIASNYDESHIAGQKAVRLRQRNPNRHHGVRYVQLCHGSLTTLKLRKVKVAFSADRKTRKFCSGRPKSRVAKSLRPSCSCCWAGCHSLQCSAMTNRRDGRPPSRAQSILSGPEG